MSDSSVNEMVDKLIEEKEKVTSEVDSSNTEEQKKKTSKKDEMEHINKWIKNALAHFWGGPKLTDNPLNEFKVVTQAITPEESNTANILRNILPAVSCTCIRPQCLFSVRFWKSKACNVLRSITKLVRVVPIFKG